VSDPIRDLGDASLKRTSQRKIFSDRRFQYDGATDTYACPAGNRLKPKSVHIHRQSRDYAASKKVCGACSLREQCTKNKSGRTIKRHLRQAELDKMREISKSAKAMRDPKIRQHLMKRSFAQSTRYEFDKARWRGIEKMHIQEYLTCAIQNIQILAKHFSKPMKTVSARVHEVKMALLSALSTHKSKAEALLIHHLPWLRPRISPLLQPI